MKAKRNTARLEEESRKEHLSPIAQLRARHAAEIAELQATCPHEHLSDFVEE